MGCDKPAGSADDTVTAAPQHHKVLFENVGLAELVVIAVEIKTALPESGFASSG